MSSFQTDGCPLGRRTDIFTDAYSPRIAESKDGSVSFDLSEASNLYCELADPKFPSYLKAFAQSSYPFAFRGPVLSSGSSNFVLPSAVDPSVPPPSAAPAAPPQFASVQQSPSNTGGAGPQNPATLKCPPSPTPSVRLVQAVPETSGMSDVAEHSGTQAIDAPVQSSHCDDLLDDICLPSKGKRGRKKKLLPEEIAAQAARVKLEKNRAFARENRKRKKQYIASLECQVRTV